MEDEAIVRRILEEGETKRFGEIVSRYSGPVYSKTLGLMKDEDLTRDIVQQAFIRAYSNLDSWRGTHLGGWINAIATHLALNALNKARRRRTQPIEECDVKAPNDSYSDEHERRLQAMEEAIGRLPELDRNIIRLHYYKQKKAQEIAATLGLSANNVLVKLHRIREQLKKQINNERDE